MKIMEYSGLVPAEIELLRDPAHKAPHEHWRSAVGALLGVMGVLGATYPRPLYYEGHEKEWADAARHLQALRGTMVYDRLADNVAVARGIWREWEEHGDTNEVREAADDFLEALLDDTLYLRHYPERPPERTHRLP